MRIAAPLAALLLAAAAAPAAAAPRAQPRGLARELSVVEVTRPAEPQWFGVYVLGMKAGWTKAWFGAEERDGQRVLVGRAETRISARVGSRDVTRSTFDEKVYEARPKGRLLAFTAVREGDGGTRRIEGRCTPRECEVTITADGGREQRRIPHPGETAEDGDAPRVAAARESILRGAQLEPDRLRAKRMDTRFLHRERIAAAGVELDAAVVEERELGPEGDRLATTVRIAADGRVLEIRIGDVAARAEPEAIAKRLDKVDLFGLTRVKLQGPLPQEVPAALRYRIQRLPQAFWTADFRQTFTPAPNGAVDLTVRATVPAAADPTRDPVRGKAKDRALLAATPEIDSDHPAIRKLAGELVGRSMGVYAASRALAEEVHRRLEKAYGASRDRASEVLAAGRGDCTEHTLLFVALARAAGVPARPVHGLVFARYDDGVNALYWHAWPEVQAGDEWIALDPTFGQPVADATHIALGRGTQVDTVSLLGSIQVVSAERVQ